MIGITTEEGITHPDMKEGDECEFCEGKVCKITIENHSVAGHFFNALECEECGEQFNIIRFTKQELDNICDKIRVERNKLNRKISALKKENFDCDCKEGEDEIQDCECYNCGGKATPKQILEIITDPRNKPVN